MKSKTLAERIIDFNASLYFDGVLPEGIHVMNPFLENPSALAASSAFYRKYYADNSPRHVIVGINPGRFGAGLTGVPFTDPKRLVERCGITGYEGMITHEPSSVFMYEMIRQYGGEAAFYGDFYITSFCPLGFTRAGRTGREVNFNYYDSKPLYAAVKGFMVESLRRQLDFGFSGDTGFVLGTGKNVEYLSRANDESGFFKKLIALEHPRYIMQYKARRIQEYVDKYLDAFSSVKKTV
ncbi:DUF4918 family protein [Oxalobacter sp. OttesenSCG-928-P03]|nr:DUF4918 family protein [Oxalobacter sp. OttesenSCG-928-P03]